MKAKDIMRRNVVTVSPLATAKELAELLTKHKITGVPVVDSHGALMGVVSQTDIVRKQARSEKDDALDYYRDVMPLFEPVSRVKDEATVFDLMTPAVLSADEETPVGDLARQMLARRIHRLPITRNKRLVGIISTMDILRAFVEIEDAKGAAS
jgi:CBS domain-containing protein